MIEVGPDNRCPVCGRYMKRTETGRLIQWECSNTQTDHDYDGG